MYRQIQQFISNIATAHPVDNLKHQHCYKTPVPYTIIDNFLPQSIFEAVVNDIKNIPEESYTVFSNNTSYRKECRNFYHASLLQTLSDSFHSSKFINWIQQISGIDKLIPDPHLRGGGLARISSGDKLDLHTDFNWNDQLQLNRKVNSILYLTPNWQPEWDGNLELWNREKSECVVKIEPKENRFIFWNYEPWLIHGCPQILKTPNNITRDNLIHFYYTSNATWEVDPKRSQFY